MEDFKNVEIEYKSLQNQLEKEKEDLNIIETKLKSFQKNISILKDDILNIPDVPNGTFNFLNQVFQNFITNIKKNLKEFGDIIESSLENFFISLKYATENNLNQFNEIINNLYKEKEIFKNKRDQYFNDIEKTKNINNDKSIKKDENILNNAMKENFEQLYKYEFNKMKEIIEQSNTKYNKIYCEMDSIKISLTLTIKDYLKKFAKNIYNISESFNILSKDLNKNLDLINPIKNKDVSKNINKFTLSETEFSFENIDKNNNDNQNIDNIIKKIDESKGIFKFFRRRSYTTNNIKINFCEKGKDFVPIIKEEKIQNEEQNKDHKQFIVDIIKKIIGEQEIKMIEFTDLFNILTKDINKSNDKEKDNTYFFLNKIKNYNNNRVISFKNKNNFIHLSNIMNSLCLMNRKNNNIFMLIIEVSQKLKYKNDYMYKIIQRKNEFFSTKTLWINLIDDDLLKELNEYVENIFSNSDEKSIINKNNKISEDEKFNIFEKTGLNNKIINYKKLDKSQKNELIKFAKEKMCIILSKTISSMCCFLVPENIINEIIIYYGAQFKFEYDLKCYLKNIIIVINGKIRNQIKYCPKKEEYLNNKIICISSISKFLPIKDYLLLFKVNKKIYPNLRKQIFINLLSDKNLSIDSHLLLWKEYLQIEKIKKNFKYKDIKELIYISIDKGKINEEIREESSIDTIDKDLKRTAIVDKNNFIILKSILVSFLFLFPKIGYFQGMNFVVSFLYQLLNYNEEETFYFFCGLELNTKYHEIFEDDFETLKTYFKIFEKILNINRPEIYYKFMDIYLTTDSYMVPWFITLFTQNIKVFNKNNIPKFVFFIIERFIIEGWSVIFNCGFTLLEYCYDKIMTLDKDKLISYVINILEDDRILKNENFEKLKELYLKNSKFINEFFIEKLIEINKFEENNNYLNKTITTINFNYD